MFIKPYNVYRISHFLYTKGLPVLPNLLTLLCRLVFGCYFPHTIITKGEVVLGYGGLGVVVHGNVVFGRDCHVDQGVTIGGTSKKEQVPCLGDHVYVGAGAKILGPISIGNNVVIGANSVVVKSIPDHSLVVGVPGKVIKTGIIKSDYV